MHHRRSDGTPRRIGTGLKRVPEQQREGSYTSIVASQRRICLIRLFFRASITLKIPPSPGRPSEEHTQRPARMREDATAKHASAEARRRERQGMAL
jgi:hypothetical protein